MASTVSARRDEQALVLRCDGGSGLAMVLVLPGSEHVPSRGGERMIDGSVSVDVSLKLGLPVAGVHARGVAVDRAGVPEASVDEDSELLSCEHDVWPDRSVGELDRIVLAEAEALGVQQRPDRDLGLGVVLTVGTHAARNFWAGGAGIRK